MKKIMNESHMGYYLCFKPAKNSFTSKTNCPIDFQDYRLITELVVNHSSQK